VSDNAFLWLEGVMYHMSEGVFLFDAAGQIVQCNHAFAAIIGTRTVDLFGLDLTRLSDRRVAEAVKQCLQGKMRLLEIDYTSLSAYKTTPVRLTLTPSYRQDGHLLGGVGIVKDLTRSREVNRLAERQLAFEHLVADISKSLMSAKQEKVDALIDDALAKLGQFFAVDRCYVFQFHPDGRHFSNTHEWCAPQIKPMMIQLQDLDKADFPWLIGQLEQQQVIHLPCVAQMGPSQREERAYLEAQGIQSLLIIAMVEHNQITGFIGIDSVRRAHAWPEDKIILLQVAAETFSNAFSRRNYEKALQRLNQQYQNFAEQVPLGLYIFRLTALEQKRFDYCNRLFLTLNGVENLSQVLAFEHVHPDDAQAFVQLQQQAWSDKTAFVWEGRFVLNGETRWMRIEDGEPHQTRSGDWVWNGFQQDITERKLLEQKLQELATIDDMTGLWNRRYFMHAGDLEFERAQRYQEVFSVLMVDADRFKHINDVFGHAAGDAVLAHLAQVMQAAVRKVDVVGRLGGEEFAVLLPKTGAKEAALLAERLREAVAGSSTDYDGQNLTLTVSIGVACYHRQDSHFEQSLLRADKGLYQAKADGRNRVVSLH
jgi:diguanylate cyclase (GGDEF)-like protein/PAS domain S-box-containing protein